MPTAQDIEADVRERVKDTVIDGIEQGMRDQWGAIQNPAGWVAGTEQMPTAAPGTRAAVRSACRRWARGAGIQGPVADMTYRPVCKEYLDDLGELPGGGEFGPGFTGGQCPVTYFVNLVNTSTTVPTPASGQAFATGPISGVETVPGVNPGTVFVRILGAPPTTFRTGNEGEEWSISSVSRVDAGADNCGNPKDGYTPTAYLPDDGGGLEPIEEPGFPPFVIDIGPDGNVEITFPGFDGPGREIPDPFTPRDPSEYGPELPPAPDPGDRGTPDAPTDVSPGGDAEGEEPDKVLVGVKVTLTTASPKARVSYLGGQAYYSYAYTVMMGGQGLVERDNDSAFAPAVAFYHAPENSNNYLVAFRAGFGGRVVPYWKEV